MGDRGNIIIDGKIWLYTHWCGSSLPKILKRALIKGKERWNDRPYLTRVIFQEMIGKDKDITGFGIDYVEGDGGVDLNVNTDSQTVDGVSFEEYCND